MSHPCVNSPNNALREQPFFYALLLQMDFSDESQCLVVTERHARDHLMRTLSLDTEEEVAVLPDLSPCSLRASKVMSEWETAFTGCWSQGACISQNSPARINASNHCCLTLDNRLKLTRHSQNFKCSSLYIQRDTWYSSHMVIHFQQ